jgi:hypothetical protein
MKKKCFCSAVMLLLTALPTSALLAQAPSTKAAADKATADKTRGTEATADSKKSSRGKADNRFDQMIASLSDRIELTPDQKSKIKSVMQRDDEQLTSTFARFGDAHAEMIQLEAEMVAAMDDILEPVQKQKVEEQRQQKQANSKGKQLGKSQIGNQKADANQAVRDSEKSPEKTADKTADKSANKTAVKKPDQAAKADSNHDGKTDDTETVVWTMVIVPVQEEYTVAELNDPQTMQCDRICQAYHGELVALHQQIRSMHDELVQLEARQIRQVESVLSTEQLAQLKANRQHPAQNKLSAARTDGKPRTTR